MNSWTRGWTDQVYGYRISAVDRAGNESSPSEVARGKTPEFEPVRIELAPESAEVRDMKRQEVPVGQALFPKGSDASATWSS